MAVEVAKLGFHWKSSSAPTPFAPRSRLKPPNLFQSSPRKLLVPPLLSSLVEEQPLSFTEPENLLIDALIGGFKEEGAPPLLSNSRRLEGSEGVPDPVKAMTSDINLIVRALQSSAVVEVQGDTMRKHGDWINWVRHHSMATRISSVTDISTGIQEIQLSESVGGDALVGDDLYRLNAQMKESDAS